MAGRQTGRMVRHARGLAWALVALVGAAPAGAALAAPIETPRFRVYGAADGLPSSSVFAVEADHEGGLWVGTGDGLARFDGVEFAVFQHDPRDPGSLPSNVMQALHVDPAGRVWVGSEGGGLSVLEPEATRFRHYRRDAPAALQLDDVWAITSTPDGALWFGGYGGGLYRLDLATDTLRAFRHDATLPDSLGSDHVLALAVDRDGQLWIGGSAGLDRWTGSGFAHHPAGPGGPAAALILSLTPEPDGTLWIGTPAGLDRRQPDGTIAPAPGSDRFERDGITGVVRDGPDSLWIASRNRLHRWRDGRLDERLRDGLFEQGIRSGAVLDIARDADGGLWFANLVHGLLYLPPDWRNFAVLARDPRPDAPGLQIDTVRAVAAARGGGWWAVGDDGPLHRIATDGSVERYLGPAVGLPARRFSAVLETADGAVWLGHEHGFSRFEPASGRLRHWLAEDPDGPLRAGAIDLLIDDGAGGLWLSAHGAGIERRAADGTLLARFAAGDGSGLGDAETEQFALDRDGRLWLAGGDGLARLSPAGDRLVPVAGGPSGRVYGFAFSSDGRVWTHRFGALERWRMDGETLRLEQRIDAAAGLPNIESGGLAVDAAGAVWLTSRRGLWRHHPQRGWRQFGVRDGLRSPEFVDRPLATDRAGRIAAGAIDSLVLFDPAAIAEPAVPAAVRVHALSIVRDGEPLRLDPGAPLALRHSDRELRVVARLQSFVAPASRRYRMRLDGFDDGWIDVGASGERIYSRLPAGRFTLAIEGAGADGAWTAAAPLELSVRPPWWQTAPALAGGLLLAAAAIAVAWQRQRRRQARRQAVELAERQRRWALQASDAKSRFLATLGHEIRTPMTGVLGMTELLLGDALPPAQRGRAEAIQRSGELMLRLVNDALDLARIEAGKLSLLDEPFALAELLAAVGQQQAPLAGAKGLQFVLEIDPALAGWRRGDRLRLKQVLLNLLGNAIKFTEHGVVALRASAAAGSGFVIEVSDSGPGLAEDQCARLFQRFEQADGAQTTARYGGSGLGLAISQELVGAMGGRIVVDSAPGLGSCFRIELDLPSTDAPPAAATVLPVAAPVRLLLVEDDPVVADVIAGLLAAHGHTVVHAAHGLAALAEFEQAGAGQPFALAILDLDLPGIDGLALAGLLRSQGRYVPLLALTARADPDAEPASRAAGFDGFLRKPVDGRTLAAAIAALLDRREPAAIG